jgi:hypothetical protein
MRLRLRHLWPTLIMLVTMLGTARSDAQVATTLTDQDRADIRALTTAYAPALLACKADEYADLFATPGGYFGSGPRGEVREREAIKEMVLSYDRCHPGAPPSGELTAAPAGRGRATARPAPIVEWAPEGARSRIINSNGGGYYDDVYVKTPKGWRFKSRNVVSDAEVAAHLATEDFIEIRQLAGDDHGHYENLYGPYSGPIGPRNPAAGRDDRPFRTSGLKLTTTKDGVAGLAYLRGDGGHYEDLYVKTPQGWRIKERKYFPPAPATTETKAPAVIGAGSFSPIVANLQ